MSESVAAQEQHVQEAEQFLHSLRKESGNVDSSSCPVCGSYAWEHEVPIFGYCSDCGFDLNSELSFARNHSFDTVPYVIRDHDPGDETNAN